MTKRLFDVLITVILLPVAILACVFFALLYLLFQRENPFYVQTRVGLNQKPFPLIKLRTMKTGTPQSATHNANADDVTKLGRFMRSSKLDELPQLLNVLAGQMSLVGPRPCLYLQTDLINERERRGVLAIKPGITGYAQVNNIDMSDDVLLAIADEYYVKNQNLAMDISLLVCTLLGKGTGDRIQQVVNNKSKQASE